MKTIHHRLTCLLLLLAIINLSQETTNSDSKSVIAYEAFSVMFTKKDSSLTLQSRDSLGENNTLFILNSIQEKTSAKKKIDSDNHSLLFSNNLKATETKQGVYDSLRNYHFNLILDKEASMQSFQAQIRMFIDDSNITLHKSSVPVHTGCLLVNLSIVNWVFCKEDCVIGRDCCVDLAGNKEIGSMIEMSIRIKGNKPTPVKQQNSYYNYDYVTINFPEAYVSEGKQKPIEVKLDEGDKDKFLLQFDKSIDIQYTFFICPLPIRNWLTALGITWLVVFSLAFSLFMALFIFRIHQIVLNYRKRSQSNISINPIDYSEG